VAKKKSSVGIDGEKRAPAILRTYLRAEGGPLIAFEVHRQAINEHHCSAMYRKKPLQLATMKTRTQMMIIDLHLQHQLQPMYPPAHPQYRQA
jgi:hypothetical protein